MFFLGAVFAGLWFLALLTSGARVERQARRPPRARLARPATPPGAQSASSRDRERAHPRPGQARRRPPRPGRRGARPDRAQGPARSSRWSCARSTATSPTGTTPSTSSAPFYRAAASSSSPPARSSRWCSRATRRSRASARWRAPPTRRGGRRAPSAATSALSNRENLVHALGLARVGRARDRDLLPRPLDPGHAVVRRQVGTPYRADTMRRRSRRAVRRPAAARAARSAAARYSEGHLPHGEQHVVHRP